MSFPSDGWGSENLKFHCSLAFIYRIRHLAAKIVSHSLPRSHRREEVESLAQSPSASLRRRLLALKNQLPVVRPDFNLVTRLEFAGQQLGRERIQQMFLDRPLQWPRTELRV